MFEQIILIVLLVQDAATTPSISNRPRHISNSVADLLC